MATLEDIPVLPNVEVQFAVKMATPFDTYGYDGQDAAWGDLNVPVYGADLLVTDGYPLLDPGEGAGRVIPLIGGLLAFRRDPGAGFVYDHVFPAPDDTDFSKSSHTYVPALSEITTNSGDWLQYRVGSVAYTDDGRRFVVTYLVKYNDIPAHNEGWAICVLVFDYDELSGQFVKSGSITYDDIIAVASADIFEASTGSPVIAGVALGATGDVKISPDGNTLAITLIPHFPNEFSLNGFAELHFFDIGGTTPSHLGMIKHPDSTVRISGGEGSFLSYPKGQFISNNAFVARMSISNTSLTEVTTGMIVAEQQTPGAYTVTNSNVVVVPGSISYQTNHPLPTPLPFADTVKYFYRRQIDENGYTNDTAYKVNPNGTFEFIDSLGRMLLEEYSAVPTSLYRGYIYPTRQPKTVSLASNLRVISTTVYATVLFNESSQKFEVQNRYRPVTGYSEWIEENEFGEAVALLWDDVTGYLYLGVVNTQEGIALQDTVLSTYGYPRAAADGFWEKVTKGKVNSAGEDRFYTPGVPLTTIYFDI